jgi:hypothetical protein
MHALTGMGLLSAAVLLSQVALIRVFSVAQFYHLAFLVISLALLGFGASGSILALWPRLRAPAWWPWYALGFGLATPAAYLLVNTLPIDSYAIAWDQTQLALLVAYLLVLAGRAPIETGSPASSPGDSPGRALVRRTPISTMSCLRIRSRVQSMATRIRRSRVGSRSR